ncbi:hypothetical protein D3227_40355, partial [Mesorhizobium waimense]
MLAHPTLDRLNTMGLTGMAKAFNELAANAEAEQLSHGEWLALLLDREWSWRYDRKLGARLRFAKLRHQAAPEDVDYRGERGLDRVLTAARKRGQMVPRIVEEKAARWGRFVFFTRRDREDGAFALSARRWKGADRQGLVGDGQ